MIYKVVPFIASNDHKTGTSLHVAVPFETLVNNMFNEGWAYIRLGSVTTFISPDTGCFEMGGKPGYNTTRQMILFSKV